MDNNVKTVLTDLRSETGSAESGCVNLWHSIKRLLEIVNDDALSHRGTALMREQLLDASEKISEGMNALSSVKDLLDLVVPFELAVDGDADGVD